jgi:hypothetical protein
MAAMMATGLIKRQSGIYYLTPFGQVILLLYKDSQK